MTDTPEQSQAGSVATSHPTRRRYDAFLIALTMLLFAGPIVATLLAKGARWTYAYLSGESMYYLAIARNVARYGHVTYDGQYPTNGFHPLWQICVVLIYRVAAAFQMPDALIPTALLAASVIVISIAIWVLGKCFVRAHGGVPIVFVFLPLGVYGLLKAPIEPHYGPLWSYADGMESCLVILSYALLLYVMVGARFLDSAWNALLTGAVVAVLCLSRLDHMLLAVPLFGCLMLRSVARRRGRDVLLTALAAVPVLLVMAGYFVINVRYAGTAVPISGIIKSSFPIPVGDWSGVLSGLLSPNSFIAHGMFWRVAQIFVPMVFALVCLARAAILLAREKGTRLDFALCVTALFVLMLGAYNWLYVRLFNQGHWYFPISVLFVSLFAFHVLARYAPSRLLERKAGWCLLAVLVVSAGAFSVVYSQHRLNVSYHDFLTQEIPALNEHYEGQRTKLIEYDDGLICYGADFQVMSGTLLGADKGAVYHAIREGKSLLPLAYDRGFDRMTTWGYGRVARELEYGMSCKEVEHIMGAQSYLSGDLRELGKPSPFLFSVDYVSPSHELAVLRMRAVDEWYFEARERRRAGDWQGVVEALERVSESDDVPRERMFQELGEAYMHTNDAAKAAAAFQRALDLNRALLDKYLDREPGYAGLLIEVYTNMGAAHFGLGNSADAGEACHKAIDLGAAALGEQRTLGRSLDNAYLADIHGNTARAHRLLGDATQAVDAYRKGIELDPRNAELREGLADVLAEMGGFEGALEACRTAAARATVDEKYAESVAQAAAYAAGMGDWDKVVEGYRTLVGVESNNAELWLCLANGLDRANDLEAALEAYRAAIAVRPDSVGNVVASLSDAGYSLVLGDNVEQALQRYRAAIAFAPDEWYAYDSLDKAFVERDDAETRIAEWRRAVQEYPQAVRPLFHLGMALQHGGHTDEAIETFKKALARDPHDDGIRGQLGCVLAWEGDFDAALQVCREPAAIEPAFAGMVADALEAGANALMAQDRAKEASEGYRGAIELAPDKGKTVYPTLVGALCESGDYDGAWREVALCRQQGIGLPDALLETLRRGSGKDAGSRNE